MELKHKKVLGRDDTVDHIDRNKKNDKYYNLKIIPRIEHIKLDVKRRKSNFESICPECGSSFVLSKNQIREQERKIKKAGPFCSRSCTGKYGTKIQAGGTPMDRIMFPVVYYTNKDIK